LFDNCRIVEPSIRIDEENKEADNNEGNNKDKKEISAKDVSLELNERTKNDKG